MYHLPLSRHMPTDAQKAPTRVPRFAPKHSRAARRRAARAKAKRRGLPLWAMPAGVGGLLFALIAVLVVANARATPTKQYDYTNTFPPVNGIECGSTEQLAYHIHAHLAIYANGSPVQVPYGIGIESPQPPDDPQNPYISSGVCFYWIHTHDNTGIVHIESPVKKTFTLGDLFDIWGQPLNSVQVGQDKGMVVAFRNGEYYSGNPRALPLTSHAVIQLDVGGANPPAQPYTFPDGA